MIVAMLLLGCTFDFDVGEPSDAETREVPSFSALRNASGVDLLVTVGPPQAVEVLADDDELGSIHTAVEGDELVVTSDAGVFGPRRLKVRVPALDRITVEGMGDVMVSAPDGQAVTVTVAGHGDAVLSGRWTRLVSETRSLGDITVTGLEGPLRHRGADHGDLTVRGTITGVDLTIEGMGDATVRGVRTDGDVQATVGGMGDITLEGTAGSAQLSVEAHGDIDAAGLKVRTAHVRGAGRGDLSVHASESVRGTLTDHGDLEVQGDARVDVATTGRGEVRRR